MTRRLYFLISFAQDSVSGASIPATIDVSAYDRAPYQAWRADARPAVTSIHVRVDNISPRALKLMAGHLHAFAHFIFAEDRGLPGSALRSKIIVIIGRAAS